MGFWTLLGFLLVIGSMVLTEKMLDNMNLDIQKIVSQTVMFWSGVLLLTLSALNMAVRAIGKLF